MSLEKSFLLPFFHKISNVEIWFVQEFGQKYTPHFGRDSKMHIAGIFHTASTSNNLSFSPFKNSIAMIFAAAANEWLPKWMLTTSPAYHYFTWVLLPNLNCFIYISAYVEILCIKYFHLLVNFIATEWNSPHFKYAWYSLKYPAESR